jgi:Zn-finger nucleic acid-binding protein
MKCPACGNVLQETKAGDITVDVCKNGCGGIWFDNWELKKVDEAHEAAGESLLSVEKNPNASVDHQGKRNCPRCETQIMLKHFFCTAAEVEVDECPKCGGYWLDNGELSQIRSQFASDEARTEAAQQYFQDNFGGELAGMRAESEAKAAKAKDIAKMFRFICPTRYIPGKQEWGAF